MLKTKNETIFFFLLHSSFGQNENANLHKIRLLFSLKKKLQTLQDIKQNQRSTYKISYNLT